MNQRDDQSSRTTSIRSQAEVIAGRLSSPSPDDLKALSSEDVQTIVHDLRVHQIELEMQNEELQRVQHELEVSHARFVDLYDHAPTGSLTIGENGIIQGANLTAANLLGVERRGLVNQPMSRFVLPEDQDIYYLNRRQLFATGRRQVCELRLLKSDASHVWTCLEASVESDSEGNPQCRATISDITERKRADDERARLLSQLAHAQKLEAIGTLAGGIAHEFNNILGGVLAGLSLLEFEQGRDDAAFQQDIDEMKLLVERAAGLTRQLLGFARRGSYDARPLDVALVARKTLQMFGRTRKDIALVVDGPSTSAAVLIDHTQLEQVVLNLFINAGQSMAEGGTLALRVETVELGRDMVASHGCEPGRFVKIVVSDTGVGMDADTQARIFEPFFTTKTRGEGTGLGLAAVYGIVKGHGGFIHVTSEVGRGSIFMVFLPASDLPAETVTARPESVKPGAGTILVVDDEAQIARLTARLLERIGYSVLIASSGKQAVSLMEQHRKEISLVILDMVMPEMSGSQTYDALRALEPDTKVLLASGYSIEGEAQDLLDRGCRGFIQKPFSIADLSAKLRELL